MKKTDFLFVYEIKNRELENICLLKYELEKRGYTVELVETWQREYSFHEPIDSKVTVSFAMYSDDTFRFISSFAKRIDKLVNLQWEQVYTNADEQSDTMYTIKGVAMLAVHICWGRHTVDRLRAMNIPEHNIALTGHVGLDFLREELSGYYQNRKGICDEFSIPNDKRMHLFISSFSYVGMPDSTLETDLYQSVANDPIEFRRVSEESQSMLLEWFRRIIRENENDIIIYRPHPAEVGNPQLTQMAQDCPSFYVIGEYSVKQWILIADSLYTWYSTSIAEVFAAGKKCAVLRPYHVPRGMDMPLYAGAVFVSCYDHFERVFLGLEESASVSVEVMNDFYYVDEYVPSYIKVCDKLQEVIENEEYCIDPISHSLPWIKRQYVKLHNYSIKVCGEICRKGLGERLIQRASQKRYESAMSYIFSKEMATKNHSTKKEIRTIQCRIAGLLDKR